METQDKDVSFVCSICCHSSETVSEATHHINLFHSFENNSETVAKDSQHTPDNKRARADWNDSSTKLLISAYKEKKDSVGKLKQFSTYNKLYEYIAEEMKMHAYDFSASQIKQKWDALTRSYKDTVKSNKQTGQKRKRCLFQPELDEIFRNKRNVFPEFLADAHQSWEQEIETKIVEPLASDVDLNQTSTSKAPRRVPVSLPSPGAPETAYVNSNKRNRSPMKKIREMLQSHHEERMEALQKWRQEKMAYQVECEKNRHKERLLLIEMLREKNNI